MNIEPLLSNKLSVSKLMHNVHFSEIYLRQKCSNCEQCKQIKLREIWTFDPLQNVLRLATIADNLQC